MIESSPSSNVTRSHVAIGSAVSLGCARRADRTLARLPVVVVTRAAAETAVQSGGAPKGRLQRARACLAKHALVFLQAQCGRRHAGRRALPHAFEILMQRHGAGGAVRMQDAVYRRLVGAQQHAVAVGQYECLAGRGASGSARRISRTCRNRAAAASGEMIACNATDVVEQQLDAAPAATTHSARRAAWRGAWSRSSRLRSQSYRRSRRCVAASSASNAVRSSAGVSRAFIRRRSPASRPGTSHTGACEARPAAARGGGAGRPVAAARRFRRPAA